MKRLVLVGPGHAHLLLLRALARAPLRDVEVVLVARGTAAPYSGLASALLAGELAPEALRVDLPALARAAGAWLETSGARELRAGAQETVLEDGRTLAWDVASVAVGSHAAGEDTPGVRAHAVPLKPLDVALARLTAELARPGPLVVVGGGASGVELALCLRARAPREVVLVEAAPRVLPGAHPRASAQAARLLAARGVRVHTGARVTAVEAGAVRLEEGASLPFTTCLWAPGSAPAPLLARCDAARDAEGFLCVHDTLESVSHPGLFAAGDCAGFASGQRVPRSGVYAVREAPVLEANVRARLAGAAPRAVFRAQRAALALLNVGNGRALGMWRGLVFEGAWVHRWKRHLDSRWMRKFPGST